MYKLDFVPKLLFTPFYKTITHKTTTIVTNSSLNNPLRADFPQTSKQPRKRIRTIISHADPPKTNGKQGIHLLHCDSTANRRGARWEGYIQKGGFGVSESVTSSIEHARFLLNVGRKARDGLLPILVGD